MQLLDCVFMIYINVGSKRMIYIGIYIRDLSDLYILDCFISGRLGYFNGYINIC